MKKPYYSIIQTKKNNVSRISNSALIEYFPKGIVPLDRIGSTLTQMRRLTI